MATEFVVLAINNMLIVASYTLAYLMIARLGGNIFITGIILSLAEAAASVLTGLGMQYMSDIIVTRICAVFCVVFNLIFYFWTGPEYPVFQYCILFLAVMGQHGPYNVGYIVLEFRLPPKNLGAASSLILLGFGPLA